MASHKAPGTSDGGHRVQRAAAVCTGTAVLGLGVLTFGPASPAFATTDPPPLPQPVTDLVQQVSHLTGLPNPLDAMAPAATPRLNPKHQQPTATPRKVHHVAAPARTTVHRPTPIPMARVVTLSVTRGALRAAAVPAVAAPQVVRPASALTPLPALPQRDDTARILFVVIATILLGGLAGGHIKAAQEFVFAH